jgi:nucleoside-diphosphate-sugar epimerase
LEVVGEDTVINADTAMVQEVMDFLSDVRQTRDYARAYTSASDMFGASARVSSISPRAGYAFGKYIGELSTDSSFNEGHYVTLRLANVFGPGDHDDRIVPKFIKTAQTGGTTTVFDWSRNFIWIDDLIEIIEEAINGQMPSSGLLNAFTPGNTFRLWDLSQIINSLTGPPGGEFILKKEVHEPHFQFNIRHPEMLPANPVGLREGLSRLITGK